jgi:thiamine-phosphate pyrophosphorylase
MRSVELAGIYCIVDADATPSPLALLDAVLAAGVRLVQYRAKRGVERDICARMCARTHAAGAALIVNDDIEGALVADGLHVGQEDLALLDRASLRALLGKKILGISCSSIDDARAAADLGADYLGVGPFAVTASKGDAGAPIGARGVRAIVDATALPVAAIGGIELSMLDEVARSGARMAAVISAIARGPDPGENARALVARWDALNRSAGAFLP